jgi:hypothetical protein
MAKSDSAYDIPENTSVLRLIRENNKELIENKKYKNSYRVVDELTGSTLAECDLFGNVAFVHLDIDFKQNGKWQMRPNRKVMPSRWSFFAGQNQCVYEIRRASLFRLMNPFSRLAFYITDKEFNKAFKLEDRESGIGDQLFGSGPFVWSVTEQGKVVATIKIMSRKDNQEIKKGFFNMLKRFFKSGDWVLLTPGTSPVIKAPVYLGLMLLLEEHTRNVGE